MLSNVVVMSCDVMLITDAGTTLSLSRHTLPYKDNGTKLATTATKQTRHPNTALSPTPVSLAAPLPSSPHYPLPNHYPALYHPSPPPSTTPRHATTSNNTLNTSHPRILHLFRLNSYLVIFFSPTQHRFTLETRPLTPHTFKFCTFFLYVFIF